MRACLIFLALAVVAKRRPAFIPAEDDEPKPDKSLNYRPLKSVHYHITLGQAGETPTLVAMLDETAAEHDEILAAFNRSAKAFNCLPKGGAFMMAAGTEARAQFIAGDTTLPSVSIFRGEREIKFSGAWTEVELRNWVYAELTGMPIIKDDREYDALLSKAGALGKTVVGFVDSLCSPAAVEYTNMVMEHREHTRTQLPAAICANKDMAKFFGMPSGTGLMVVSGRGEERVRNNFPEDKVGWTAAGLKDFVLGMLGADAKLRRLRDEL